MPGLAAIIEELLVATIISEKVLLPRKSVTGWALIALSGLLACTGIFLSILGLDRFLEERYTADMAALIAAAVVFTAALITSAVAYYIRRRKAPRPGAARDEIGKNIRAIIEDISSELDEPVQENPKTAVLLAALAGFLTAQHRA